MAITFDDITGARNKASSASNTANYAQSSAANIGGELTEALKGVLSKENSLVEKRAEAESTLFSEPSAARARYADPNSENYVFNPYQRQALVDKSVAQAYKPYAMLTDYLGMSYGSIPEIVNSATGAYNASITPYILNSQTAQNDYSNILSQYGLEQQAAAAEAAQQQQDFQNKLAMLNYQLNVQKANDSGGSGSSKDFLDYIKSGGNIDSNALIAGVLSGEIPAAAGNFVSSMLGLNPDTGNLNEKSEAYSNVIRQAQDALKYLTQGSDKYDKGVAGINPLFSLQKSKIGGLIPGAANPNRVDFERILADLAGPQAFGEAGKALTETEKSLIIGKVPEAGRPADYLESQLNSIINESKAKQQAILDQIYGY